MPVPEKVVRANPSTQQTNTALLPAQTNRAVNVKKVYVSSDTKMTITLVNSEAHTILFRLYVGKDGGVVLPTNFWSAWNEGIDYTTSAAGNVFLMLEYDRVGRG